MNRIITAIFVMVGIFTGILNAQQTLSIDTVTVATTQIPLKANETGRNITVLKGEILEKIPYTSIDELLQFIPGVELQSRNAFGAQADISIRGATFTQVLVLVDGMKLNDPLTAHFNGYIPVTPAEIERIEVLRGAAAAMYGADAVGGIVHIITKAFAPTQSVKEGASLEGTIRYGDHSLVNIQQGFSLKKDRLQVSGGFYMNQSDGELVKGAVLENQQLEDYYNYFDNKTVGAAIGYQLTDNWAVRYRTAYDDRDFSARYFYTTSTFDKSTERARNWWNQMQIKHIGNKSSTDINLAYKYNTDEFVFSPDFPSTNNHITQFANFQINHLHAVNDILSLKFGLQLDKRSIESNDRGNHEDWHTGIYAMGVYQPISKLHLTGSLRLDYDQNYDLEVSPQLNISYNLPSLVLRASAGRSIRAADYTERYVSTNLENLTPGRSLGNPDLMAENGWTEEIGFDYYIGDNWTIKATGFFRQSSNLIDYISTNADVIPLNKNLQAGENYFFASNIADVNTNGIELELWYKQAIGDNASINWSAGYTYLDTQNKDDVISVYISSHAGHLFNTNALLSLGRLDLGINGVLKVRDERVATSINTTLEQQYSVWNINASYNLVDNVGLNLQIHNVFDENYQNILGAKMPGRWLMGGIKYKF